MFGSQDLTFAGCRFECGGKIHMSASKGDVANKRIEHREYWPSVKRDSNTEICRQTMPAPARLASGRWFKHLPELQRKATRLIHLIEYHVEARPPRVHRAWLITGSTQQS